MLSRTILAHDPDDKRRYALDFAPLLAAGDSLADVTVTVVQGTATVSTGSTGGGPSAAATITGSTATIWVLAASVGTVALRWRATCASGEQLDVTTQLAVTDQ